MSLFILPKNRTAHWRNAAILDKGDLVATNGHPDARLVTSWRARLQKVAFELRK
jgi:hypothetical protein